MSDADKQPCDEWSTMLHGFVDDELDPVHTAQFENHLATCAGCTQELERTLAVRQTIGQEGVRWQAPDELRARVLDALSIESGQKSPARQIASNGVWHRCLQAFKQWGFAPSLVALAASLLLFVNVTRQDLPLQEELVSSHVRSMLANHLTDVLTSDQHTVKPWFNGKIDFSPPVVDLAAQGFPLIGGRVDYLGGRVVAALIYRRHGHIINVFVWPASPSKSQTATHDGYNLDSWSAGGLVFWAISDVSAEDLSAFRDNFLKGTPL